MAARVRKRSLDSSLSMMASRASLRSPATRDRWRYGWQGHLRRVPREGEAGVAGGAELGEELGFGQEGDVARTGGVDGERLLEVAEDADVVDDEAVGFASKTRLARAMVCMSVWFLHRLVEVDGGEARDVEAGDPHGADEDEPEGIGGVLELGVQVLLDHAHAVRQDVEALLLKSATSFCACGDDDGHVGLRMKASRSGSSASPASWVGRRGELRFSSASFAVQRRLDLVVHPDGGGLVDGDDHRLCRGRRVGVRGAAEEVVDDVGGDASRAGRRG